MADKRAKNEFLVFFNTSYIEFSFYVFLFIFKLLNELQIEGIEWETNRAIESNREKIY